MSWILSVLDFIKIDFTEGKGKEWTRLQQEQLQSHEMFQVKDT